MVLRCLVQLISRITIIIENVNKYIYRYVQHRIYLWQNSAFYDKSITVGRQLQYAPRNSFVYRDIADWSQSRNCCQLNVDNGCTSEYGFMVNLVCLFHDISRAIN